MRAILLLVLVSFPLSAQNTNQDANKDSAPPAAAPANSTVDKLRVVSTAAVTNAKPDDWGNTVSVENKMIDLNCPACTPAKLAISAADVTSISYGEAAYHHWKAGIATAVLSLGVGAVVGFWPHHRHFLTLEMKDNNSVAIQADKTTYRPLASLLNSATGLPIEVNQKQVNDLKGIPVQVKMQ